MTSQVKAEKYPGGFMTKRKARSDWRTTGVKFPTREMSSLLATNIQTESPVAVNEKPLASPVVYADGTVDTWVGRCCLPSPPAIKEGIRPLDVPLQAVAFGAASLLFRLPLVARPGGLSHSSRLTDELG